MGNIESDFYINPSIEQGITKLRKYLPYIQKVTYFAYTNIIHYGRQLYRKQVRAIPGT